MLKESCYRASLRCIKYDWRYGTLAKWRKLIPMLLMVCFSCIRALAIWHYGMDAYGWEGRLSIGDFIFWNFKGMEVVRDIKNTFFMLDGFWIFFHLYLAYVIGFYPNHDIKNGNCILLLRSEKRICWWIGKCVWVVFNVLTYYAAAFLTIIFMALLLGKPEWNVQPQVMENMYAIAAYENDTVGMYVSCMGMSIMMSLGLSMVQMAVCVIINPVIGLCLTAANLVAAVFVFNSYLPGNYLMLLRSRMILMESGVSVQKGVIPALFMIILSFSIGYILFAKKDIYPDEVR